MSAQAITNPVDREIFNLQLAYQQLEEARPIINEFKRETAVHTAIALANEIARLRKELKRD
jgi:hypothetical protein